MLIRKHLRAMQLLVPAIPHPLLECEVMPHAKDPAFQIGAWLSLPQMLK
jgi:hypothetical protein